MVSHKKNDKYSGTSDPIYQTCKDNNFNEKKRKAYSSIQKFFFTFSLQITK